MERKQHGLAAAGRALFAVAIIVASIGYMLPAGIALLRTDHRNRWAIFFLNLFLGWTILGWVVAFVWACMSQRTGTAPVIVINRG